VQEYLQLHFEEPSVINPLLHKSVAGNAAMEAQMGYRFAQRCAHLVIDNIKTHGQFAGKKLRVLDVGCAVGGHVFELSTEAEVFAEVVGMDYSHAFIEAANEMKKQRKMTYGRMVSGHIREEGRTVQLGANVNTDICRFQQGSALDITADDYGGKFDAVLAANLLCRLPDPRKFLEGIAQWTNDGAVVVFISPYSWLEAYTLKEHWVGGTATSGPSSEVLPRVMVALGFEQMPVQDENVAFLIREHERKFQWGVSHVTVFRKKMAA
jgi:putative 4-mercaptohistidine N1-methyltranferase